MIEGSVPAPFRIPRFLRLSSGIMMRHAMVVLPACACACGEPNAPNTDLQSEIRFAYVRHEAMPPARDLSFFLSGEDWNLEVAGSALAPHANNPGSFLSNYVRMPHDRPLSVRLVLLGTSDTLATSHFEFTPEVMYTYHLSVQPVAVAQNDLEHQIAVPLRFRPSGFSGDSLYVRFIGFLHRPID